MKEFTKGTWTKGNMNEEPFARSCLSIFREDGRKVAEAKREGFMEFEEAEANARLIAAAPTMYEALRKVRANIGHIIMTKADAILTDEIDKALAQAEGKL